LGNTKVIVYDLASINPFNGEYPVTALRDVPKEKPQVDNRYPQNSPFSTSRNSILISAKIMRGTTTKTRQGLTRRYNKRENADKEDAKPAMTTAFGTLTKLATVRKCERSGRTISPLCCFDVRGDVVADIRLTERSRK
jgi:hypothetical protein